MWKKITIISALIVVLIIIIFVDQKFRVTEDNTKLEENQSEEADNLKETLVVKHQYRDGEHVFIGDITLPTPCHSYNAFIEDTDDEMTKNLQVVYTEPDSDVGCITVTEDVTFRVAYEGPENLNFRSFVNGEEYRLNIFEIPETVDIDEFEIFLKG